MEIWKDNKGHEHQLRLTVGHCLTLRGTESDVTGNPVPVLLGLRDPGISVPILAAMIGQTVEEVSDGLTGERFHELQAAVEESVVDFFRADPSFSEFLTKVRAIDETTRREAEADGLQELETELRTARNLKTDPTGGNSVSNPPESPESTPDPSVSATSSPPPEESPASQTSRPPNSSQPSTTPTHTGAKT